MEKAELERENEQLREIIRRYHHHLKIWRLVQDAPLKEIGAWMVNGAQLQRDTEEVIPELK